MTRIYKIPDSDIHVLEQIQLAPIVKFPDDIRWVTVGPNLNNFDNMERVMGIEPTSSAWEAEVLPLNYTRPTHT